jgi:endonuclease/exonuclease/phosphatase family metal-dependent hydrolase
VEGSGMPEVIGVCEAENRSVLEDLAGQLEGGDYEIVHYNSPDGRGIDVALLYRGDALDTLATRSIEVPVALTGGRPGRDILYVAGLSPGGDTLHLFVNHWKSRWGGKEETEPARVATALVLKSHVSAILKKNPAAKVIIMGDFNDSPMDKSIDQSLGAKAPDKTKEGKLINIMRPLAEKGLGSHAYKGEWNMLDQIIVSGGLYQNLGDSARAGVFKAEWMLYTNSDGGQAPSRTYGGTHYFGGYSDHLPVYLILR